MRCKAIDGIRGIIAIIIVLFHFEMVMPYGKNRMIFSTGYLGVEFFFILSGFLLAYSYYLKKYDSEQSVITLFKKKICRLYAPYVVSILALIFLYTFVWYRGNFLSWIQSDKTYAKSLLVELLGLQATGLSDFKYVNYPLWYVSALLVITFILLIVLKYCKENLLKRVLPVIVVLIYGFMLSNNNYMASAGWYRSCVSLPLLRATAGMSLGITTYYIWQVVKKYIKELNFHVISILETIFISWFLLLLIGHKSTKLDLCILVPSVMLILLMFSNRGLISRILEFKVFTLLGKVSYSFYLMQSFSSNLQQIFFSKIVQPYASIVHIMINLVVSILLYFTVEKLMNSVLVKKKQTTYYISGRQVIITFYVIMMIGLIGLQNNVKAEDSGVDSRTITVTALNKQNKDSDGAEICIKGVYLDDKWYDAKDLFQGTWIIQENEVLWRNYDQPDQMQNSIEAVIQESKKVVIVLKANKWTGVAEIKIGDYTEEVDCYKNADDDLLEIDLSSSVLAGGHNETFGIYGIITITIVLTGLYFVHQTIKRKCLIEDNRELWVDLLKVICVVVIVLMQCTCNAYEKYSVVDTRWFKHLYINVFTTFAIPVLFMLSGAVIIKDEENYLQKLLIRLKGLIFPLLIWSILYIGLRRFYNGENISVIKEILTIPAKPAYYHLWLVYTFIGLYLLSPLLAFFYYHCSRKLFTYCLCILGGIPFILKTVEVGFGYAIKIPGVFVLFPEAILLLLGRYIYDHRDGITGKWNVFAITGVLGYGLLVGLSYYTSVKKGSPDKTLFLNYGTLPSAFFYVSIYCMFVSLHRKINNLSEAKKKYITVLSKYCVDIYFSYALILELFENRKIGHYVLTKNTGSLLDMFIMALLCIIVCIVIACVKERTLKYDN